MKPPGSGWEASIASRHEGKLNVLLSFSEEITQAASAILHLPVI
jgi:hypothetical protein